jgi:hypothetical protein
MKAKKVDKVVEIRRVGKRDLEVVLQTAIAGERIAHQEMLRAFERWSEKHNAIRSAIEGGAIVEEGLYRADLSEKELISPIFGLPFIVDKLTIT